MTTVLTLGYKVTQEKDKNIIISKNGKTMYMVLCDRIMTGPELADIAFWALVR